jgi:protein gp37
MQQTKIGWTDFSANLLKYRNAEGVIVWACVHASEGCRFCYSEALAKRWGRGEAFTAENMKSLTPFFDTKEADEILRSKKIAGKKVFIDDMTDLFGEWVSDEIIDQHFAIFALRPDVTFQVLTKRAERMREYMTEYVAGKRRLGDALGDNDSIGARLMVARHGYGVEGRGNGKPPYQAPKNVHFGVSVEDERNLLERVPELVKMPGAVKWLSIEPLLSPITTEAFSTFFYSGFEEPPYDDAISGIVIGGESGHGHREMPLANAIKLARDAQQAGAAVYFKQDSGPRPGMQGRVPDDVWAMKDWPVAKAVTA